LKHKAVMWNPYFHGSEALETTRRADERGRSRVGKSDGGYLDGWRNRNELCMGLASLDCQQSTQAQGNRAIYIFL